MATYRESDGRWMAYARTGKGRKNRKACYGKTEAEADAKAAELEAALASLPTPDPPISWPEGSFAEFAYETWVPHVYPSLRKTSQRSYDSQLANHLMPALGHVPIAEIGYYELKTAMEGLSRVDGKGPLGRRAFEVEMRAKEILGLYASLRSKSGKPARTDWEIVRPPEVSRKKEREEPPENYTEAIFAQCVGRFAWAKGPAFAALFLGLRRGEIAGLMWSDIDRRNMTIRVSQQRQPEYREGRVETKGEARTIPIPAAVLEWLDRLGAKGSVFVFTGAKGTPIPVGELSKVMPRLCERAGLPKIGLHDQRSLAASNLQALGVDPVYIMEILGHKKLETSLIYINGRNEAKRQALESLLNRLTG